MSRPRSAVRDLRTALAAAADSSLKDGGAAADVDDMGSDDSANNRTRPEPVAKAETLGVRAAESLREILTTAEAQADTIRQQAEAHASELEQKASLRLAEADRTADALIGGRARRLVELSNCILDLSGSIVKEAEGVIAGLEQAEAGKRQLATLVERLRDKTEEAAETGVPGPLAHSTATSRRGTEEQPPAAEAPSAPTEEPPPAVEAPSAPTVPTVAELQGGSDEDQSGPGARQEEARLAALNLAVVGRSRMEVAEQLGRRYPGDLGEVLDEVFGANTPGTHRIAWRAYTLDDVA